MRPYTTILKAINSEGELRTFCGPHVEGISMNDAQDRCEKDGKGYLIVTGELIATIATKKDSLEADMTSIKNYENINLN